MQVRLKEMVKAGQWVAKNGRFEGREQSNLADLVSPGNASTPEYRQ